MTTERLLPLVTIKEEKLFSTRQGHVVLSPQANSHIESKLARAISRGPVVTSATVRENQIFSASRNTIFSNVGGFALRAFGPQRSSAIN